MERHELLTLKVVLRTVVSDAIHLPSRSFEFASTKTDNASNATQRTSNSQGSKLSVSSWYTPSINAGPPMEKGRDRETLRNFFFFARFDINWRGAEGLGEQ